MPRPRSSLYVAERLFTKEWHWKTALLQQVQFAFATRGEKCLCKNEISSSSVMLCIKNSANWRFHTL